MTTKPKRRWPKFRELALKLAEMARHLDSLDYDDDTEPHNCRECQEMVKVADQLREIGLRKSAKR